MKKLRLKKLNFIMMVFGIIGIYSILFAVSTFPASLVGAVVLDLGGVLGSVDVSNYEQCVENTVYWTQEIPVFEDVIRTRDVWSDDCEMYFPENDTSDVRSCITGTEEYISNEQVGTNTVELNRVVCEQDTSYLEIKSGAETIKLDYALQDYKCVQDNNKIICDSKNDGNGDGICQSGESCALFELKSDKIILRNINSGDQEECNLQTINGVPFEICVDESVLSHLKLEVRE